MASVQEELTRMRIILQDLEARLEAGEVPPEGLPEFKSTVDEIRLRVWALHSDHKLPRNCAGRPNSAVPSQANCLPGDWPRVTPSGRRCSRRSRA